MVRVHKHLNAVVSLDGMDFSVLNVRYEKFYLLNFRLESIIFILLTEAICRDECHPSRGYCEAPGECRCRLGWAGSLCRECQVLPGCMHGTCSQPLECKCLPGWRGVLCQIPMCSETCHKRYGYCTKPNDCRCKVGWTGENCDVCVPYPGCKNGSCRRPWECNCLPGWGSHLCDESKIVNSLF